MARRGSVLAFDAVAALAIVVRVLRVADLLAQRLDLIAQGLGGAIAGGFVAILAVRGLLAVMRLLRALSIRSVHQTHTWKRFPDAAAREPARAA